MSQTLTAIAQKLKDSQKKMQLIYAFNGSGKTRLSREFVQVVDLKIDPTQDYVDSDYLAEDYHGFERVLLKNAWYTPFGYFPKSVNGVPANIPKELLDQHKLPSDAKIVKSNSRKDSIEDERKILYYNAFTEDLFYWDNDLNGDLEPTLKIQNNRFTDWILRQQGQDQNIVENFQRHSKITPIFDSSFSQVTFSLARGDDENLDGLKISKGEESRFIWTIFYTLLEQVIEILNVAEPAERETDEFNELEYVFIDDPVSSLDDNHLIELAVNLSSLTKSSKSDLKFIITTHNPLFYNVLHNELGQAESYRLNKTEDGLLQLEKQNDDSPFSYHLFLLSELQKAIESDNIKKYHFNFIRNILEKTATFLGYKKWSDLLPKTKDGTTDAYKARILNISSHSKHAGEEIAILSDDDKRILRRLVEYVVDTYNYQP